MAYEIRIANPCSENWYAMTGNERSRFCTRCDRTVVNFSVLTCVEIEALLDARKGSRLCRRYLRRADGTMITRDPSAEAATGTLQAPCARLWRSLHY